MFHQKHSVKTILLLFTIVATMILPGCMTSTQLQILEPAAFTLPDHIQSVATVNRSLPPKKFGNAIEAVLTGEEIYQDRDGANMAIDGLTDALTKTPRFTVKHTGLELIGSGQRKLPAPISWRYVEEMCKTYGTDALIALEAYDSDISQNCNERKVKKKDKDGNEYTELEYKSELNSRVHLGWRLYDPKTRKIYDEMGVTEEKNWREDGDSRENALNNLPDQRFSVNETSFAAGIKYGMRIAPTWVFTERSFYTKGSDQMKMAARKAKVADWAGAEQVWQRIARSSDPKLAKKATFNLALAAEAQGYLSDARVHAMKSFSQYNLKKGRHYAEELERRIYATQEVEKQMTGYKEVMPEAKAKTGSRAKGKVRINTK